MWVEILKKLYEGCCEKRYQQFYNPQISSKETFDEETITAPL